jgi:hypothetical protein
MSTRASLSETLNRLLPGEQNKRIREAILQGANYSGQRTDQLRRSIDEANRIQTGILVNGEVVFTSTTNADVSGWAWASNFAVQQQDGTESITVNAPDAEFARPDYFIGMPDGTIDYRPSTIDLFGNSIAPDVESDEVVLRIVQRNSDESNTEVDPALPTPIFTDAIFQTANQANTVGKYALVWEGTLYPNGNYQIHLLYGATSADPDWVTSAPGKSGYLVLNIFSHDGLPITGSQFYTVDTNSEDGDWVLLRTGDQIKLYHYSTQYWMRVKFRVLYNNFTEVIAGFKNFEAYATLPSGADQQLNSVKFAGGGGISDAPSDAKVYGRKDAGWVDAKPVNLPPYANQAAMLADQANQIAGFLYQDNASTWAKLATSTGVIGDYVKVGDIAGGGGGGGAANVGSRLYLFNNY